MSREISQFEEVLKEDCKQYRELAKRYLKLTTEDFKEAYELTQMSWALAQRWSDIQSNAKIIATANGINKTDFSTWAYQRYRQLQQMFDHTRVVWRMGKEEYERSKNIR